MNCLAAARSVERIEWGVGRDCWHIVNLVVKQSETLLSRFRGYLVAGVLVLLSLFLVSCVLWFFQAARYYGEAEVVVDTLILPFRNDLSSESSVTTETLLDLPKYSDLKRREIKIDLEPNERVRFHINEKFDISVMEGGAIHWHNKQAN